MSSGLADEICLKKTNARGGRPRALHRVHMLMLFLDCTTLALQPQKYISGVCPASVSFCHFHYFRERKNDNSYLKINRLNYYK